jgi:enamine deaminase RidA (YjgF/YER057c/UK114 family)
MTTSINSTSSSTISVQSPLLIPTPDGAVVVVNETQREIDYSDWHYAPARIAGSLVILSGIVTAGRDDAVQNENGFVDALRRTFGRIDELLTGSGSDFAHVVEISSFHVFGSKFLDIPRDRQIDLFRRVKDEYFKAPYPAWTAVGVTELFPPRGFVEVRIAASLKK